MTRRQHNRIVICIFVVAGLLLWRGHSWGLVILGLPAQYLGYAAAALACGLYVPREEPLAPREESSTAFRPSPDWAPNPKGPMSFGYKCAWYAVRTNDVDAVVDAMRLVDVVESDWAKGIEAAYANKVFVTPPLGDWILIAGVPLFHDESPVTIERLLAALSERFGEAQYFCTHRVVDANCWALARSGEVVRAFGFLGERGEITWQEGTPTQVELDLGERKLEFPGPSEDDVMKVAAAWSLDPTGLEGRFVEPGLGRLGAIP